MKIKCCKKNYKRLNVFLMFSVLLQLLFANIFSAASTLHKKTTSQHTTQQNQYAAFNKKDQNSLSLPLNNKKQNVRASQDGESVWSNAFNFGKSRGTQIDPRSGILTAYFKVASLISNMGHGPSINLQINYNSNSFANPDKLGAGWSWNLTHFNPMADQLTTASGQSFYLHQQSKYHWQPRYHKLEDIKIDGDKSTHFVITYANGLRETLSHQGYETQLEQQNGWKVYFLYKKGTHLLAAITDDDNHKITLHYTEGYISVISHNSNGQPFAVNIKNKHDQIKKIFLSADTHLSINPIYIEYNNKNLLTQITYSTGLKKTFAYGCNAIKLPSSNAIPVKSLCAVSRAIITPGAGQPEMTTRYAYSRINANGHNYLGFNAGLTLVANLSGDILFEAPVDYTYKTAVDNGIVTEEYTYNKYHLLINDKLISQQTGRILSETDNFFCDREGLTNNCTHTSFKDLPLTYSLPLKTVTREWGTSSVTPALTTLIKSYDNSGRVISTTDSYGRVIQIRYCPVAGDNFCPASPQGWLFNILPESTTVYSPHTIALATLPAVTTYNYYKKQPNLNNEGYMLVLDHQIRQAGYQHIKTMRYYYDNLDNAFIYGLLKRIIVTGTTGDIKLSPSVVDHYYYTENSKTYSKTTWHTVEADQHSLQYSSVVETSLFTNQVLKRTDPEGNNITHYHYDALGRLIQVDLAAKTDFATTLRYQYTLLPEHNQLISTAANGLQKKIIFDNAGRALKYFDEIIDTTNKIKSRQWLIKKSVRYDAYGRLIKQYSYMIDDADKVYSLQTTKDYDDMGRVSHIYLPDGETIFMLYDNGARCMVNYRQNADGERSDFNNVDSAMGLSGLHHAACTPSVYASQPRSPPDRATLDSGWWPALAGQGSHLLGRVEGFQPVSPFTSPSPFTKLCLAQ